MISGTTLILISYSFVYVPELLLQGTWLEISAATVSYAFGYAALAVAIQGTDFFPVKVTPARRGLFLAAAVCFLFPMIVWLKIAGAVLLALAWGAVPLDLRAKASRRALWEKKAAIHTPPWSLPNNDGTASRAIDVPDPWDRRFRTSGLSGRRGQYLLS